MNIQETYAQIISEHNRYLNKLKDNLAHQPGPQKQLSALDKIDRVMLHVIEELIEMRRTYPHKFWKQSEETYDKEAMLEEMADVFLMSRSMYLEACQVMGITEEDFLEAILKKVRKNHDRINSGY